MTKRRGIISYDKLTVEQKKQPMEESKKKGLTATLDKFLRVKEKTKSIVNETIDVTALVEEHARSLEALSAIVFSSVSVSEFHLPTYFPTLSFLYSYNLFFL
jgi:hypothetical protein